MKVYGLTGSIAMGKSEVAKIFRRHGIPVFDSDAEVHDLYDSQAGVDLLRDDAPDAVQHGRVDRKILSDLVLKDGTLLSRLESKVHTEIRRRREVFLQMARTQGAKLALVDVPLLFETGADREVDATIVVSAPEAAQRMRALARPGMIAERLDMILKRQMPDAEKRKRANYILENGGTLADLETGTERLIERLMKDA